MKNAEAINVLLRELQCIERNDGVQCDRKCESCDLVMDAAVLKDAYNMVIKALKSQEWIPCSEKLPSKEERKEWIDKNLDGIGYLYPCLVTRYSSINQGRMKNNPYVAKHYFDGEDFVNCGEEVCSEYVIAWMPLPEPYRAERRTDEQITE